MTDKNRLSEPAKAARREYQRKWRNANKDKIKANTARYWERKGKALEAEQNAGNDKRGGEN